APEELADGLFTAVIPCKLQEGVEVPGSVLSAPRNTPYSMQNSSLSSSGFPPSSSPYSPSNFNLYRCRRLVRPNSNSNLSAGFGAVVPASAGFDTAIRMGCARVSMLAMPAHVPESLFDGLEE